jgi:hypothetical protein
VWRKEFKNKNTHHFYKRFIDFNYDMLDFKCRRIIIIEEEEEDSRREEWVFQIIE